MFGNLLMLAGAFVGFVIGASFGILIDGDQLGLVTAIGAASGTVIGWWIAWSIRPEE